MKRVRAVVRAGMRSGEGVGGVGGAGGVGEGGSGESGESGGESSGGGGGSGEVGGGGGEVGGGGVARAVAARAAAVRAAVRVRCARRGRVGGYLPAASAAVVALLGLAIGARLRWQRGTAALTTVELDRRRLLRTCLDRELREALLAARLVDKLAQLAERAGCLTVWRALGALAAGARRGTLLVVLPVPLDALLVPAARGLTHERARWASALGEIARGNAEALGLEKDVFLERAATLRHVLLIVDTDEEVCSDLLVGVVLHMAPVLSVEHLY